MRDSSGRIIPISWQDAAPPEHDMPYDGEEAVDYYWTALVLLKTPFQSSQGPDYRDLVDVYRQLEAVFIADPELRDYYEECNGNFSAQGDDDRIEKEPTIEPHIRNVVMLQAQFMEDAHYVLRLDRYANAPDNRGWMNLFRAWSRSPRFRAAFESIRRYFTADFIEFYDAYIAGFEPLAEIDRDWVPHPWDGVRRGQPSLPGIYLDSGIREGISPRLMSLLSTRPSFKSRVETGEHGAPGSKESGPGGSDIAPQRRTPHKGSPPPGSNP